MVPVYGYRPCRSAYNVNVILGGETFKFCQFNLIAFHCFIRTCLDGRFSSTVKLGQRHPDPVVETSSLSSVEPSNIWYHLSIPESTIDYGYLSALQLESIVYTSQKHQVFLPSGDRAGFLIGVCAVILEGSAIISLTKSFCCIQTHCDLESRSSFSWLIINIGTLLASLIKNNC